MRSRSKTLPIIAAGATAFAFGLAAHVRASVTVDGVLSPGEGYVLEATQTINTGFGDSTAGDGTSSGGSELDAAYAVVSGGNLNLFFSGNTEWGNHLEAFVSDGRPGQSVLNVSNSSLSSANGSAFSPGFLATYAVDVNEYQGTCYVNEYTYGGPNTLNGGYIGSFNIPSGTPGVATIGWNDTNAAGVNGNSGTAANAAAADAVTTGMELSIPLSALGNPTGPVEVLAAVNGNPDNYLSNQFLPGLPVGTGNVGGGGPFSGPQAGAFNFAATPGEYFTVSVPEPATLGLIGGATMMILARRRKP